MRIGAGILAASAIGAALRLAPSGTRDQIAHATAQVAQASATVVGTNAALADEVEAGRHLGFDTHEYPGDVTMRAWKASDSPYEWVGYYLVAPCHRDDSWASKRTTLAQMGWGVAVVYVGQQSWGRAPRKLSPSALAKARRQSVTCSADYVSAARGRADANDAIARAQAEGFPKGTVVFLDIERMDKVPAAMREYYRAWVDRLLAEGTYKPGVYAHTFNAVSIHDDVKAVYALHGNSDDPPFWVASTRDFSPEKAPSEVGHGFAGMWQGILDVSQTWAGIRLPIDVNISQWASPSLNGVSAE
ncbi:MAG: hypothetical protein JWO05_1423 [Gemmatimonadetes bacterium]|nr:hypothetical protein [Gemmatimonadota bacterium]